MHGVIVSTPDKDRTLFPGLGCRPPQVSVARSAEALQRSLKTSEAQLVSLEIAKESRVVSWDFWV